MVFVVTDGNMDNQDAVTYRDNGCPSEVQRLCGYENRGQPGFDEGSCKECWRRNLANRLGGVRVHGSPLDDITVIGVGDPNYRVLTAFGTTTLTTTTCWSNPTDVLTCADGSEHRITSATQWYNCDRHGGRLRCPAHWPFMCASKTNTDAGMAGVFPCLCVSSLHVARVGTGWSC